MLPMLPRVSAIPSRSHLLPYRQRPLLVIERFGVFTEGIVVVADVAEGQRDTVTSPSASRTASDRRHYSSDMRRPRVQLHIADVAEALAVPARSPISSLTAGTGSSSRAPRILSKLEVYGADVLEGDGNTVTVRRFSCSASDRR